MNSKKTSQGRIEDEFLESSSNESLSEDDEDGWMLTEEVEKEFYKTLSQIKNKDPTIYKKNAEFFKNVPAVEKKCRKQKKSTPLTLREYERKLVLEKGGDLSDEDINDKEFNQQSEPTYVEEQESLKKSLKDVLNDASEDEDDKSWGGLFKKRDKTKEEKKTEENHYKEWLKGQKESLSDEEVEKDMKPLRTFWTDPNLNEEDQFLRDYILNKKFLECNDENEDTASNILVEKSEEAKDTSNEQSYKHRFEEPDQEFVKRYPRIMENSVRRKNDHRKQKRDEIKERKLKDKEKKRAEIKLKKKLKKVEIEQKLEELKKLTGNDKLAFENVLNEDFDIDEHDRAMKQLFSDEFYSQEDQNFHPTGLVDTEFDEPWDEEGCEEYFEEGQYNENREDAVNCEDPNFNMDCDYDPTQVKEKPKESRSRRRKDKHKRTAISEAVNREKPKFNPSVHKSFKDYLDQYYALDCEDFIGDLPCRFKYRQTVPNSYGLTIEEILAADEKELDRWCSIKRIQQLRPEYKEKCDVKVYKKKAEDERLKRKILPSLFKKIKDKEESDNKQKKKLDILDEEPAPILIITDNHGKEKDADLQKQEIVNSTKKSKNKKKKNAKNLQENLVSVSGVPNKNKNKRKHEEHVHGSNESKKKRFNKMAKVQIDKKTKNYNKPTSEDTNLSGMSDARLIAYGIKPKKFRNKLKYTKNK